MAIYNLLDAIDVFKNIGFILLALLVLMIMITVHEFGHYIVGKLLKFKINEFAIGMGPAIFKHKAKNGELFSIRIFPFGGYCSFEGEDEENPSPNAFNNKKPWQRILVLLAGATMNYLLALLIIIISMNVYGQSTFGAAIIKPSDGVYAEMSLQGGDYVTSIEKDGRRTSIFLTTDLVSALNHSKAGDEIKAEVIRDGKKIFVPVKLRSDVECYNMTEIEKVYDSLGVGSAIRISSTDKFPFKTGDFITRFKDADEPTECSLIFGTDDFVKFISPLLEGDIASFYVSRDGVRTEITFTLGEGWNAVDKTNSAAVLDFLGIAVEGKSYYTQGSYQKVGFFTSLLRSVEYAFKIGGTIFRSLGELLTGKLGLNAVGGTITTIRTASKVMSYGLVYAFEIMAFIGVNLAVFNLLPIPALDGSKIVFCIIEWLRKKPINRKVEAVIHLVGFVLILGFAVLVDVLQFI